jgi:trigger factor
MQVNAEQTDPCTIVLDISVDEQQVARTFDSVYREFSRYANVPGFRPGKAPRAVLERYVDAGRVRERTLEKLITDSYYKALEEEAITPFRPPRIEPTDLEDKKPYTYKAVVPLEPQVTLGEYTGLTVEKPVYTVTEDDIDHAIERLREGRARLDRVTDRGVQTGDVLIAENQVQEEGEAEPTPPRRQLIQVGGNIPGFDDAIMGMNIGEERVFTLTYPDDYDEEERRGKPATFTVKLSSISAKKLPELNDDFAQQVADVPTVAELRDLIRKREEETAAQMGDQVAENRLIQEIVQQATIHFPEALVIEEVEDDLRELGAELRQRSMSYEQFLTQSEMTQETHQQALRERAAGRIVSILALREIALQEGIQVSDEEIDAEFDRLLSESQITEDQYAEYRPDQRRRLQVANALTQQRLHDFLFAHNTINEVAQARPLDPEAAEAASAEAEPG